MKFIISEHIIDCRRLDLKSFKQVPPVISGENKCDLSFNRLRVLESIHGRFNQVCNSPWVNNKFGGLHFVCLNNCKYGPCFAIHWNSYLSFWYVHWKLGTQLTGQLKDNLLTGNMWREWIFHQIGQFEAKSFDIWRCWQMKGSSRPISLSFCLRKTMENVRMMNAF